MRVGRVSAIPAKLSHTNGRRTFMAWALSVPNSKTKKSLLEWADDQIKQGVPRQIICEHLLAKDSFSMSLEELEASSKAESELFGVMVQRNLKGKNFESTGKLDKAIELYEANVADWFIGDYPYDRLRLIYSKRKQIDEALRVCNAFVKMADTLLEQGSKRSDLTAKREKFTQWNVKLEKEIHGKS
jgi:tetratricopeptide (TPR) repeat protein